MDNLSKNDLAQLNDKKLPRVMNIQDNKQYNEPNSLVCEATQVRSYKVTCVGELVKPYK